MESTFSTISQTPRLSIKRPTTTLLNSRASIESPKLRKVIERTQAQEELKKMNNRLVKLTKIDKTLGDEIKLAMQQSIYMANLQKQNLIKAQNKSIRKEYVLKNIECRRSSINRTRMELRERKAASVMNSYLNKKSKADLIKELKRNWESAADEKRKNSTISKNEFARQVRTIYQRNKEKRSNSQISSRTFVAMKYADSIEEEQQTIERIHKKIQSLEVKESYIIEKLSNTLSIRNEHFGTLNNLLAVSKLPISLRTKSTAL